MKMFNSALVAVSALALVMAVQSVPAFADTAAPASTAAAQAQAPLDFGVLDFRAAMQNSDVGKALYKEIGDKMKENRNKVEADSKKMDDMRRELASEQKTAKAEDFSKKVESFKAQANDLQEQTMKREDTLNKAATTALHSLQDEVGEAASAVAKKHGLAAIFARDAVVVAEERTSITAEVIDYLNKNGKKIKVDWTGGSSGKK